MSNSLRFGGTAGIIGVLLFVATTLVASFMDTGGVYASPGYALTLENHINARDAIIPIPENTAASKIVNFITYILVPIAFLAVFYALREWMEHFSTPLTGWLYALSNIAMTLWLLNGVIRVLLIPATQNNIDPVALRAENVQLLWLSLGSSLFDGAYLLIAIHGVMAGWLIYRQNNHFLGGMGVVIGLSIFLILILSPYESENIFSVYTYGAPIVWFFALSAKLLIQADKLERELFTPSTAQ